MGLLCTREELDEMCRDGTELIHEALDGGDPAAARGEFARICEARAGLVDLMVDWTSDGLIDPTDTRNTLGMALSSTSGGWTVRVEKPAKSRARVAVGGAADHADEIYEKVYLSEDGQEGPRAFAEKRKPVWKGR